MKIFNIPKQHRPVYKKYFPKIMAKYLTIAVLAYISFLSAFGWTTAYWEEQLDGANMAAFKIVTSIISAIMIVAIVYIAQRIQMQEHKANQEIYLIDQKIQTYDTHQHLQNHPLNMTKKQ